MFSFDICFFELVVIVSFLVSPFVKKIFYCFFGVFSLFTLQRVGSKETERNKHTSHKNETLAVAHLDTLENGTFEWIPDPRVLIREVLT